MTPDFDLTVIAGDIDACGSALYASGRGLSVCPTGLNDPLSARSALSVDLFPGGLRALEYFALRLGRKALIASRALNAFGDKITTSRPLAEPALENIAHTVPKVIQPRTTGASLPAEDAPIDGEHDLFAATQTGDPFLTDRWAKRLVRTYGSEVNDVMGAAEPARDFSSGHGADLARSEVTWLMKAELAQAAAGIESRRSTSGSQMTAGQIARPDDGITDKPRGPYCAAAE